MKAIVVIPTYNEVENVENIVNAVLSTVQDISVLVVDDNSPDGTADVVRKMMQSNNNIHLKVRAGKLGLGTAYCEGFKYCLEHGFEAIFEMDADFSHNPKDVPRLLEELESNNLDLVIGSRYIKGFNVENWPLSRLVLSYGASVYTRMITGMPIMDATGGFKCFRASALKNIDLDSIHSNGYSFQIEMNYRMWINKFKIKEISIVFTDRLNGISKMNKSIIYEAIFMVWKLRWQKKSFLIKK
jgi:dolichol-phosphate mannosyltransferase